MLYNLVSFFSFLIFKTIFGLKVFGKNYIPKKGAFILASNHKSYLDPLVLGAVSPRRLNFMARHDLFSNLFFGWLITNLHAFPVKRKSADLSALKEALRRLKMGNPLVVFPEGARQATGVFGKPEIGIGFLAEKTNACVVPVFIKGTDKALGRDAKFFRLAKISVYFGKQISFERRMLHQDIAERVMEAISHLSCSTLD